MSVERFPPFHPHWLLSGAHSQTLFAFYHRSTSIRYQAQQHEVVLHDGDAIVLHDDRPASWKPGGRIVLLVPGLGGCHRTPFMPRIAAKLNSSDFRTFRMDLRGCGAGLRLAKRPGHAGRSEDSAAAVLKIAELCPDSPVTVVGFSMGGNIVLKMLGEFRDIRVGNLDSCIAIAPPIDILSCALIRPPNRMYNRSFVRSLLQEVKRRQPLIEEMQRIPKRPRPKSLMEFDDRFTAPLSGFVDARDYYAQCSSGPLLSRIALPTLIMAAADDPMIPVSIFEQCAFSASTSVVITEKGGHMGYVGRSGVDPDRRWLDWRIVDWIRWHHQASHPMKDKVATAPRHRARKLGVPSRAF